MSESDHVSPTDWMATISLSRRSCIKLTNVESCVNRVVSHLDILREQIGQCKGLSSSLEPDVFVKIPKLARVASPKTRLVVEGVTNGISVGKKKVSLLYI